MGRRAVERWTDHRARGRQPTGLAVLGNSKQNNAVVVRTSSVPRTADRPAEHLIVVLFPVRDSIEAVVARLRLADDRGTAVIYSHRLYGQTAGEAMATWL